MVTEQVFTAAMLFKLVAEIKNEQEVVFFKIRNSCHVLSVVGLAEEAEHNWDADDAPYLEQAKHYFDFLVQIESIDCKINYQSEFTRALQRQGDKIKQTMCQILTNNLELFLSMSSEKEVNDVQHCGEILRRYTELLSSLNMASFSDIDNLHAVEEKAVILIASAKDRICEQIWQAFEALDTLLKSSSNKKSFITILWIYSCLNDHEEVLTLELGEWMYNRLMNSCLHLLQTLPEPTDKKNISEAEKKMVTDIALSVEIRKSFGEDQDMDDIPF